MELFNAMSFIVNACRYSAVSSSADIVISYFLDRFSDHEHVQVFAAMSMLFIFHYIFFTNLLGVI